MKSHLFLLMLAVGLGGITLGAAPKPNAPFRIGIVGLVHDHAQGFLGDLGSRHDIELVGIAESNPELVARYAARYKLPAALFYPSLEKMLDATKVTAVAVCSSTFDHENIVQVCAARGVNVMVEKPLAVNLAHARAIALAAARGGIQVIVNYETTWYPATQAAGVKVNEEHLLGDLRKMVVHDGHQGPREIGASKEFLAWLTDPVLDGGGALMDFGCYGANLITWLMRGERPVSVTAVTQQIKPEIYPKVDDEATIILIYPHAQGIIQASWNWPFGRKDFELYGTHGSLIAPERSTLQLKTSDAPASGETLPALEGARRDSLDFFAAVVRGEVKPDGLSSLETNLIVTEILDAARASARTGCRVDLAKEP
ncbi:MAG TPA: Gfo/Idh/MocA family oxidoreductase [Lacunisphaera sp.]